MAIIMDPLRKGACGCALMIDTEQEERNVLYRKINAKYGIGSEKSLNAWCALLAKDKATLERILGDRK